MDPNIPSNIETTSGDFVIPDDPQNPGPMNVEKVLSAEETYREKIRQFGKYAEPLRKFIDEKCADDDLNVENMNRLKKLLKILTDPNEPMCSVDFDKCEILLKELFDDKKDENEGGPPPTDLDSAMQFLLSAVAETLKNPNHNDIFHRAFRPTLDRMFNSDGINLVRRWEDLEQLRRQNPEEEATSSASVIPDVLQGEIARLDRKFRVTVDDNIQPVCSESIHLICSLEDDEYLPHVPPIYLTVPAGYPKESPLCQMRDDQYNATKYLSDVKILLLARIQNLPKYYSVSHLLDSWALSVGQAALPNFNCDTAVANINAFTFSMGL